MIIQSDKRSRGDREEEQRLLRQMRRMRRLCDLSLDDVAVAVGMSMGYLNRLERGYVLSVTNEQKRTRLLNFLRDLEQKVASLEQQWDEVRDARSG